MTSTQLAPPAPGCVSVGSLSQAKRHKRTFGAVITLEDPRAPRSARLRFTAPGTPAHLVLRFEDVDSFSTGLRIAREEEVWQALDFARQYAAQSLLVHCFHGVGRSAAVALGVLADRLGPGRELQAVDDLFCMRPEATPNLVVTALADRLLQRGGALTEALRSIEATRPEYARKRAARAAYVEKNRHLYAEEDHDAA